jgi:hypothetical protein
MLEIFLFSLFGTLIIFFIITCILSVKTILSKSDKELTQKVIDQFPKLYIEKTGTQFYLYEKNTDVFKCQSSTMDDLAKKYYEYTKSVMAFVQHNNAQLVFIEGDVIEENSLTLEVEES